ncbi:MBL fold metallo-hydrolase [soil metagenome]
MKITKLEHACLDITNENTRLIVDPGIWTNPLSDLSNIKALVITHVHPDHCDPDKVQAIVGANPNIQIFSTQQVADKLRIPLVEVPEIGKAYTIGAIKLEFLGGQHATIMDGHPPDQNFGILVNDTLYYPGDSFTPCSKPHTVSAVPAVAPWLKFSETVEFLAQDSATSIFPTHNNILNENGTNLLNRLLSGVADEQHKTFHALRPGESLDT